MMSCSKRACVVCACTRFPFPSQHCTEDAASTAYLALRQGASSVHHPLRETVTYTLLFLPDFFLTEREFSPGTLSLRAETDTPGNAGDGTTPQSPRVSMSPL